MTTATRRAGDHDGGAGDADDLPSAPDPSGATTSVVDDLKRLTSSGSSGPRVRGRRRRARRRRVRAAPPRDFGPEQADLTTPSASSRPSASSGRRPRPSSSRACSAAAWSFYDPETNELVVRGADPRLRPPPPSSTGSPALDDRFRAGPARLDEADDEQGSPSRRWSGERPARSRTVQGHPAPTGASSTTTREAAIGSDTDFNSSRRSSSA